MKHFFILLIIFVVCSIDGQQLQITSEGQAYLMEYEPNQRWLITRENNQYKIYTEDFQLITTFSLGVHQDQVQFIYLAARDFDDDDNIEVLYQTSLNNIQSVYLRDISTGQIQLQYEGTADLWYYCFCYGYLNNERIFAISQYDLNQYQYTNTYIYRSGVEIVGTDSAGISHDSSLRQNFPNPFQPLNNHTQISFSLAKDSLVRIDIYNIKGQKVKQLIERQHFSSGEHTISWDGRDQANKILASGNYFFKLSADGKEEIKKAIILK